MRPDWLPAALRTTTADDGRGARRTDLRPSAGRAVCCKSVQTLTYRAVPANEPPLPDSLTRLLETSPRVSTVSEPLRTVEARADRPSAHAALETALLHTFVYGVSGMVWLLVAGLIIHRLAR